MSSFAPVFTSFECTLVDSSPAHFQFGAGSAVLEPAASTVKIAHAVNSGYYVDSDHNTGYSNQFPQFNDLSCQFVPGGQYVSAEDSCSPCSPLSSASSEYSSPVHSHFDERVQVVGGQFDRCCSSPSELSVSSTGHDSVSIGDDETMVFPSRGSLSSSCSMEDVGSLASSCSPFGSVGKSVCDYPLLVSASPCGIISPVGEKVKRKRGRPRLPPSEAGKKRQKKDTDLLHKFLKVSKPLLTSGSASSIVQIEPLAALLKQGDTIVKTVLHSAAASTADVSTVLTTIGIDLDAAVGSVGVAGVDTVNEMSAGGTVSGIASPSVCEDGQCGQADVKAAVLNVILEEATLKRQRLARKAELARMSRHKKQSKMETLEEQVQRLKAQLLIANEKLKAAQLEPVECAPIHVSAVKVEEVEVADAAANVQSLKTSITNAINSVCGAASEATTVANINHLVELCNKEEAVVRSSVDEMTAVLANFPSLPLQFLDWMLHQNDKFYSDPSGLFHSLASTELLCDSQQQADWLAMRPSVLPKNHLAPSSSSSTHSLVQQCQTTLTMLKQQLSGATDGVNGRTGSAALAELSRILSPVQFQKFLNFAQTFGAVCVKIPISN